MPSHEKFRETKRLAVLLYFVSMDVELCIENHKADIVNKVLQCGQCTP